MKNDVSLGNVFVVMANYNCEEILEETIDSVLSLEFPQENLRLLIIDDCSADNSVALIKEKYGNCLAEKKIQVYVNDSNLGVTGTYNRGIRLAMDQDAAYVLKIDNDIVLDKQALSELLATLKANSQCKMVGGKVLKYHEKECIQQIGSNYSRFFGVPYFQKIGKNANKNEFSDDMPIDVVNGCMVLFQPDVFRVCGFFDKIYGKYGFEDFDFQLLAKARGFKTFYSAKAMGWHKIQYTSRKDPKLNKFRLGFYSRNLIIVNYFYSKSFHFSLFLLYLVVDNIARFFLKRESIVVLAQSYLEGLKIINRKEVVKKIG